MANAVLRCAQNSNVAGATFKSDAILAGNAKELRSERQRDPGRGDRMHPNWSIDGTVIDRPSTC